MAYSKWYGVLLGACLAASGAQGQVLRVVSANCEIYSLAAVPCLPPDEFHRVSPASFTSFADSGGSFVCCAPGTDASAGVEQITTLLPDSAYIHEGAYADFSFGVQAALAHSDASIVFRVDAGRRCSYDLHVGLSSVIGGGGVSIASFTLTRRDPGGAVVHSFRVQSGPGLPLEERGEVLRHGVLEAGDYAIEAHASADGHPNGIPITELWMNLKLRDVTTALAPTTWGLVKSRYR